MLNECVLNECERVFCLQIYPYEVLAVTHRVRAKLPRDVDRPRLEVRISFSPTLSCSVSFTHCFLHY